MKALYVLNNNIRFNDNEALSLICRKYDELTIVYFFDMSESCFRLNFIKEALISLDKKLQRFGQNIYICLENKKSYIESNSKLYDMIIASKPYSQFELEPDISNIRYIDDQTLYKTKELNFNIEDLPNIFTNFRKKIEDVTPNTSILKIVSMPKLLEIDLPSAHVFFSQNILGQKNLKFNGSEESALERLNFYLFESKKVLNYKETRNGMIKFDDSTKFSPWLSIGSISAKTIYRELSRFEFEIKSNKSTYWVYFELLWRDYFKFLATKYSKVFYTKKGIQNKSPKEVSNDQQLDAFKKWISSNTGDDFVDANMKELVTTGWMSNRGRQNVASFLCKTLSADWTYGAKFFAKSLLDYDKESNWGNWAYLAGVGVDPRDRKFNTQKQAQDYDPDMAYRKKFLPTRY